MNKSRVAVIVAMLALATSQGRSDTFSLEVRTPPPMPGPVRYMGSSHSDRYGDLGWNSSSLIRDGKPWTPVMGEFHFARYPAEEWRGELLKMKAGGINVVSTYVFWIFHEEEEGKFDWAGRRDLREFVRLCGELGLPVVVRIGPWCHGEVRNGGFPDWVQKMPHTRSDDPAYLAAVKTWYGQIAAQLQGQLWKDGGPVMGIQIENEYSGPAEHLETLKNLARDAGIDVPVYTRTGWPNLARGTSVKFGELLPMFGGYAEGFWDRELTTMPGNYWQVFRFARERTDTMVGADATGARREGDTGDVASYPYLTCELGGGMPSSYHRRIVIDPMDVYTIPLVKIGSGSNLPGYYMYHGGTDPDGKLSTLQESQRQNMWNDMPEKTYDFQAPLGECGEVRESYHMLRRLHLFLADWGPELAPMPATIAPGPRGKNDAQTLRWSVRSDGNHGFLFVNNYQRALEMPAKPGAVFHLQFDRSELTIPSTEAGGSASIDIPANSAFIWPIRMDVGGATLSYATAQPICRLVDGSTTYTFFGQTGDIPSEFVFENGSGARTGAPAVTIDAATGDVVERGGSICVKNLQPAADFEPAIQLHTSDGKSQCIVLLDETASRQIYKASIGGSDRVFISPADLAFDGNSMLMTAAAGRETDDHVAVYPELRAALAHAGTAARVIQSFGDYTSNYRFTLPRRPGDGTLRATIEPLKLAGAPREIKMGSQHVAAEPTDADFDAAGGAGIWRIKIPSLAAGRHVLLRVHYLGDVARIYVGGKMVDDNFYNGQPMDLGLWRYTPEDLAKGIEIRILPLQKGAPIYFAHWPEFDGPSVCRIDNAELIEERQVIADLR